MDRIAFATLLTGLIVGLQPVRVELAPDLHPTEVVYFLDGRMAARSSAPPWEARVDFGQDLRPLEVAAEALDAAGNRLAGISRLINLPAAAARLDILVDRNGLGRPSGARLVAKSPRSEKPVRMTLSLDGRTLPLDADGRAALPPLDLLQAHVLSGVAEFSQDAVARADLALGGGIADDAGSRLTAVALRTKSGAEPTVAGLQGRLRAGSIALRIVAVEKAPATVLLVREPSSSAANYAIGRNAPGTGVRLEPEDRVGLVWPLSHETRLGEQTSELIEATPFFTGKQGGFLWVLTRVSRNSPSTPPYRYADAVAVAGIEAYRSGTRRAVVLAGAYGNDASQLTPEQARGYLGRLGVPLYVWSFWSPESPYGATQVVKSFVDYQKAATALKRDLDAQRVAWVAGEWLPGQLSLEPGSDGVELLR